MEETLIKRVMPNSLEAEQSVIGSMIMDQDAIVTAMAVARSVLNNFFLIKSNLPCLVCFC